MTFDNIIHYIIVYLYIYMVLFMLIFSRSILQRYSVVWWCCCCWYRSDCYRRIEDKMDNKNDSLCAYPAWAEGAENNNCERTHYAWQGGEKCLTRARMQITQEQQDGGGSAYIHPKRVGFLFFVSHIYIKNKTEHLYCVCLRTIRHVDTRISDFIFRAC